MVLTNNVLCFLAGVCQPPSQLEHFSPLGMKDINGVVFRMRMYGFASNNNMNFSATFQSAQIGKGDTLENNNDFKIENPFTNGGVEDNQVLSIIASYAQGSELIEMITSMVAGGSGGIREVCKFVICNDGDTGVDRTCLISRDVIPLKNFIANDVINIVHQVGT